jgi:eukaryotic-like serine/threonine-protein kinase
LTPPFELQQRLGSGYFGEVWLAFDVGLGVLQAIKFISPSKVPNPQNMFQEAQILKYAECSNVVKVFSAGEYENNQIYVVMEYLPRGSVEDEVKGGYLELTRAKRLMIDVLRGLEYAHSKEILHRDIKPANILIGESSDGKLSDFGLAMPLKSIASGVHNLKDYAYVYHQAPEVLEHRRYSVLSDIYACGVTLYRLVNGDAYLPVLDAIDDLGDLILSGKFPDRNKYREFIPKNLRSLINKSMNVNPSDRYQSAKDMRHALEQILIDKNWTERILPNGVKWTCAWNGKYYEVFRTQEGNKWSIIVKKGISKTNLRTDNKLSVRGLNRLDAEKITKKILQDYVMAKIK